MRCPSDLYVARLGDQLGQLLRGPIGSNVFRRVDKDRWSFQICKLPKQRWALAIGSPARVSLAVHIWISVKLLSAIVFPNCAEASAIYLTPLTVVHNFAASDANHTDSAGRIAQRIGES